MSPLAWWPVLGSCSSGVCWFCLGPPVSTTARMATSCYSGSPGQVCSVLPLAAFKAVAHEVWWTCAGAGLWLLRQSPGLQAFIHVLALAHRVALLRGGGYCGVLHFCGEHFFGDADAPGLVKDATLNIAFVMTMMCVAVGMGYIFLNSGIDMVHRSRRLFDTFLLQVVWHRL